VTRKLNSSRRPQRSHVGIKLTVRLCNAIGASEGCFRLCRLLPASCLGRARLPHTLISARGQTWQTANEFGRVNCSAPGSSGAVQKLRHKISRGSLSIVGCAYPPTSVADFDDSSMPRLKLRPLSEALSVDQAAGDVSDTWQLNRAALRHTFCMHALTMLTAVKCSAGLQTPFHPTVISAGGARHRRRCSALQFAGRYVPWLWLVQLSATVRLTAMSRSA